MNSALVASVRAQIVAFESCNVIVNELLAKFAAINDNIEKKVNFGMEKEKLLKVMINSSCLIRVVF